MNYEELQDPEIRRKAQNYVIWLDEVLRSREQIAFAESQLRNMRESLDRLLSLTEQERQEYSWRLASFRQQEAP